MTSLYIDSSSYGIRCGGALSITGSDTRVVSVGGMTKNASYGVYAESSITNAGLLVAKGGCVNTDTNPVSQAMNVAANGTLIGGAYDENYAVYGDSSVYHVAAGVDNKTESVSGYLEWTDVNPTEYGGNDNLTLTNTIIFSTGEAGKNSYNAPRSMPSGGVLTLSGYNVLLTDGDSALRCYGGMTIDGDGALTAIGGYDYYGGKAISVSDPLFQKGGHLTAIGGSSSNRSYYPCYGIATDNNMGVTGGSGVAIGLTESVFRRQ